MRLRTGTSIPIVPVIIALIGFGSPAFGQRSSHDYDWVAGVGDWSAPENWEHEVWYPDGKCVRAAGVPGADDSAFIHNWGTAIITGSAQVHALFLWRGTLIQTGGNATLCGDVGGYLHLSSDGRYELHQGSLNARSVYNDGGIFVQTGGNATLSHYGVLYPSRFKGTYELCEGDFNADYVTIEDGGIFVQTGGDATIGRSLWIEGEGTYELHQGSLSAYRISVGSNGTRGTLIQTGGSITIQDAPSSFACLDLEEGTYEFLGGTLNVRNTITVGRRFSGTALLVVSGGVVNGLTDNAELRVLNRGSLTGPGIFNISVVYKSEDLYGLAGYTPVDITFDRNCLMEGGSYNVKQLTPDDFADGNVPNLLGSSVFDVNFSGSFCGEFEIAMPYDTTELEALDMDETNLVILHETGEGKYERLDVTIVPLRQGIARAKAQAFGKFAVAYRPPVILVHGWRPALESGRVDTWRTLKAKLEDAGIPYYEFNYLPATGDPTAYARSFAAWLGTLTVTLHQSTGTLAKFDIVCHSMGAMVSRWYMEEMGGDCNIRQWIGIAPVNNGAAIADWWLAHLRYPGEKAVEQMRIKSPSLARLNYSIPQFDIDIWGQPQHLSPDVIYRNIIGIQDPNTRKPAEKTLVAKKDYAKRELYRYWTYRGDGIVAMEQSLLQGNNVGNQVFVGRTHSEITSDPNVIDEIISYLMDPSQDLINNYPVDEDKCDDHLCDDHWVSATANRGYIFQREIKEIRFSIDSSVQRARIVAEWDGSDIDMILISPGGIILEPSAGVVEYGETDTIVCYEVDTPQAGEWTAVIQGVDVPPDGEPFEFMTFYSSPLALEVAIVEERTYYRKGDLVNITAKCTDGNTVITGSVVTGTILSPSFATENLVLYDDGGHGDGEANDGYYSNDYLLLEEGTYQIAVTAHGTFDGTPFERTAPMTLWVTSEADLTYDTKTDSYDFATFAQQRKDNKCEEPNWCDGPALDHSGDIRTLDLVIFVEHWLEDTVS